VRRYRSSIPLSFLFFLVVGDVAAELIIGRPVYPARVNSIRSPIAPASSRRVDPSKPAELIEDEARHDERDKLLPDHFLDNADDRPSRTAKSDADSDIVGRGFSMTTFTHGHAKRSVVPRLGASPQRPPTTEAVDRDAAVDAKNAPTAAWKTRRRVSHTAHRRPPTREKQEERPALARRKGIRRYSWPLPRGRFSNVPQWPHLNVR
jgi:hypothetical protein